MKKVPMLFVLLLATAVIPAFAQDKPAPPATAQTEAPKLTSEQKESLRTLQVNIQAALLQQYQNKEQYDAAQARLNQQAQDLSKQFEQLVAEASKGVDPAKFTFNRGTLVFDPVKKPNPPTTEPKK